MPLLSFRFFRIVRSMVGVFFCRSSFPSSVVYITLLCAFHWLIKAFPDAILIEIGFKYLDGEQHGAILCQSEYGCGFLYIFLFIFIKYTFILSLSRFSKTMNKITTGFQVILKKNNSQQWRKSRKYTGETKYVLVWLFNSEILYIFLSFLFPFFLFRMNCQCAQCRENHYALFWFSSLASIAWVLLLKLYGLFFSSFFLLSFFHLWT